MRAFITYPVVLASLKSHQTLQLACITWRASQNLFSQVRAFATPRGTAEASRVDPGLLKALPFSVSLQDAETTFQNYQKGTFLAAPTSFEKVKQTYIPYWLVQMHVSVRATQAQVGYRVPVYRRDPNTQGSRMVFETEWQVARANYQREAMYPAEHEGMQVCATYKFLPGDTAALRPGPLVRVGDGLGLLKPITAPGMLNSDTRVVPFSVRPADARQEAYAWIRRQEISAAEEWFRSVFHAHEVRAVNLQVTILHQASYPTYLPVYVFSRQLPPSGLELVMSRLMQGSAAEQAASQGRKVHTLVSGFAPGIVAGSKVYDPVKVGLAAGIASPVILSLTGLTGLLGGPAAFLLTSLLPMFLAALIARHAPHIRHGMAAASAYTRTAIPSTATLFARSVLGDATAQRLGFFQPDEDDRQSRSNKQRERLEDDWTHPYGHTSSQQSSWYQYRTGQYQSSSNRDDTRGPGSKTRSRPEDPRGYYETLGVTPRSSQAEIQEAFRSRALQQHPDRFKEQADKAKATASFQKLSEAYSVLRNPSKRAAYDREARV